MDEINFEDIKVPADTVAFLCSYNPFSKQVVRGNFHAVTSYLNSLEKFGALIASIGPEDGCTVYRVSIQQIMNPRG